RHPVLVLQPMPVPQQAQRTHPSPRFRRAEGIRQIVAETAHGRRPKALIPNPNPQIGPDGWPPPAPATPSDPPFAGLRSAQSAFFIPDPAPGESPLAWQGGGF